MTTSINAQSSSELVTVQKQPVGYDYLVKTFISSNPGDSGFLTMEESIYCRLGLQVLLQQFQEEVVWSDQGHWARLLGQLLPTNAGIKGAIMSLGATYQSRFLPVSDTQRKNAVTLNQKALTEIQKEIISQPQGLVPIFLACIVLGAVEVLQRRLANTLMHLQGAFEMLAHATAGSFGSSASVFQDLYAFAESLDLQRAWYALSDPPHLLRPSGIIEIPFTESPAEEESNVQRFIHSCYQFTSRASKFKYCHPDLVPMTVFQEQSRYIAALNGWLTRSRLAEKTQEKSMSKTSHVLRAQALSTLIYVSTILDPREIAYDSYLSQFNEILEVSQLLLESRPSPLSPRTPRFQLQPGIFQALYLTALKCREPQLRRKAVAKFEAVGIEGPWDVGIMTRVAERSIEVEEAGQLCLTQKAQKAMIIPEEQRIHGCGIDSAARADDLSAIQIQVYFSRCVDVATMVESRSWEDPKHWISWTETLQDHDNNIFGVATKMSPP